MPINEVVRTHSAFFLASQRPPFAWLSGDGDCVPCDLICACTASELSVALADSLVM